MAVRWAVASQDFVPPSSSLAAAIFTIPPACDSPSHLKKDITVWHGYKWPSCGWEMAKKHQLKGGG